MTAPGRARLGLLTVGTVLLGVLAAGCGAGETDVRPASVPADAGALRPFYEQRIGWKKCDGGLECGRLQVPLDYADPAGETITLAVIRKRTADQRRRIGSLLLNPGGPGASGVEFARVSDEVLTARLRARYDVVGFDPRGVGRSAAINCASSGASPYVRGVGNPRARVRATAGDYADGLKQFGARCQAGSGKLLAHVSTVEAARDMDVLRGVLGDAKLHYLGFSYGTYLGAVYAEWFPGRVGRLVLDAAVDPRGWPTGGFVTQSRGFEVGLDSFLADCAKRPDCPLGTDPKAARRRLAELLERMDHRPLPGDGAATVDKETAVAIISGALYSKHAWPSLRTAFQQAAEGKGAGLLKIAGTPGGPDDNFAAAMAAIVCLDGPPAMTSAEQVEARLPAIRKEAPIFGERAAWGELTCAYWPVKPVGRPHAIRAEGAAPILVVGALRDPATPYAWSRGLAGQLSSGVLLTYDGDGHGAYDKRGSACVNDAVDTYLIDGRPPLKGAWCR
ncbi:alpha/beta hydrolase [Nonomuraea sp. NPDC049152]|uniref:alpha/beta hydrolase n=1 Tax=Nonomuraea sp. NPDC049152 TaxID=3154350 RepID=UPI0033CDB55E